MISSDLIRTEFPQNPNTRDESSNRTAPSFLSTVLQSFSELRRFLGLNYSLTEADHFSRQSRKLPDSSFSWLRRRSNSRKDFKELFLPQFGTCAFSAASSFTYDPFTTF